jgi:hypothetical protein
MPVWIHLDSHYVRLNTKEEAELACKLVCIYHNGPDNKAPFDDDWQFVDPLEMFDVDSDLSSDSTQSES